MKKEYFIPIVGWINYEVANGIDEDGSRPRWERRLVRFYHLVTIPLLIVGIILLIRSL